MIIRERFAVWLARHDRVRRTLALMMMAYVLSAWAVATAPAAAASTGSAVLGWTGLRDSHGVPLKDMFLSVVSTSEAMTNNGQEVDWNPVSWMKWLDEAGQVWMSHSVMTSVLTWEAAAIVYGAALSFWFLRFAMSNTYLLIIAQVAGPIHAAVTKYINAMWLGPIALAVCALMFGYHYQNGRPGRAWSIAGTAAILTVLLFTFFRDPINEMTSDHGLLGMARSAGFELAQSFRGRSYASGQSLDAQLDGMMAELISNTVRPMVQLMNFGMVVDDIPGCGQAWSSAVMAADGQGPGPAHAMYFDPQPPNSGGLHCNAPQALAHAQHLGANDAMTGLGFLLVGCLIGFFIWYVGISTLLLGAKAAYYGIVVTPAFFLGMMGWQRAKNYATRAGSQLLFHGVETILFTAFLALSSLAMAWALTTGLLSRGGDTVVPRLVLVGIGSVVAVFLFHYIDKHFYTDNVGTIAHHWQSVWNSGRGSARSAYDDWQDGMDKARGLRDRYQGWRSSSDADDDGSGEGGSAQPDDAPGFDVVKDRPTRRPTGGGGPDPVDTASGPSPVTEAATTTARRSAATAEAGEAAETAADVVAPEIAVPVAATVAVAERARGRHSDEHTGAQQPPAGQALDAPATGAPRPSLPGDPPSDDAAALAISPTPAQRPSRAGRVWNTPDTDPASPRHAGSDRAGVSAVADDVDSGPLEFPAATPRPAGKGQG
ncbi:hypothetical protein OS122_29575 [Mycolicibacterium mucogenicum]|uniref:hypothetical protein n=1 Tax=Mycolicibacterium mucogenicum TaxID=56689 RepID=UPI00226A1029|nr:hypothetical protein [Mycolicibacterium mucogenicum]MCX8565037.1 hypothetical protein [Mycolicibacterium mucogenicum]